MEIEQDQKKELSWPNIIIRYLVKILIVRTAFIPKIFKKNLWYKIYRVKTFDKLQPCLMYAKKIFWILAL